MRSLGLGGSNHDFSACLVEDGDIVVGIEEERISRVKYSVGVNSLLNKSWRYCLDARALRLDDVDVIVADDTLLPPAYFQFRSRIELIGHHLAHAASTFLPSPFQRAAVLVADGAGSLVDGRGVETLTTYVGDGSHLAEVGKVWGLNWSTDGQNKARVYQAGDSDNSLGYMYKAVSHEIGFTLYEEGHWYLTEDGKTMGLAPYGTDRYCAKFHEYVDLLPDGRYTLHLKNDGLLGFVDGALAGFSGDERFARAADLAYAAQDLLETTLLHVTRSLHRATGLSSLCLAGGVALNCVANGRLLRETPFDNVFVQPAAGDGGCAVGNAYYGYHVLLEQLRDRGPGTTQRGQRHTYLGKPATSAEIAAAIEASGLPHRRVPDAPFLAAAALARGQLVGWFTGGSEFGPRALGHRSILADPRQPDMKDVLNTKVKHRESFRPFAPAVLAERAADFFDLDIESPYMLIVASVHADKRSVVPAIVHVDGTARVQTLTRADNGTFRELVEWFDRLTGVPVVLNTSYNDRGEPIVETPEQALAFYGRSQLDCLFMDDVVIAHNDNDITAVLAADLAVSGS